MREEKHFSFQVGCIKKVVKLSPNYQSKYKEKLFFDFRISIVQQPNDEIFYCFSPLLFLHDVLFTHQGKNLVCLDNISTFTVYKIYIMYTRTYT